LLVDGKKKEAVPALRSRIAKGGLGAVHALWTLQGLGALDPETHRAALIHPDAILRRNAIRALGSDAQATQLLFDSATLADKNLQTRLAAFVKLAEQEDSKTAAKTATLLKAKPENAKDEWLRLALDAAGAGAMNVVRYETGENLISNGSFEKGLEGWSFRNYSGPADAVVRQIEKEKPKVKKGAQSLRFGTPAGNDTSLFTNVNLKSGAKYRLSAWIRTEGVSGAHGALLNVHELQHEGKTNALQKTNDWKEVEKKFTANRSGTFTINCLFGGWGKSKGTAWFDEISLREIKPVYAENKSPEGVVGKVEAGRKIFQEHLVAGCVRCHALGGKGGNVGPALDGLASRKERDYVYRSLVNPSAELAEGFDKLGASPMPPMNILLNDQEIAHVMAFLMSLK